MFKHCTNYPKVLCHFCRHFWEQDGKRSFFREMQSGIKVYRCTLTWTTFLKVIFPAPCCVSKTYNSHVLFSLPLLYIFPSFPKELFIILIQSIFLTKFVIENNLIFFHTSYHFYFQRTHDTCCYSSVGQFYKVFFFHFTSCKDLISKNHLLWGLQFTSTTSKWKVYKN